MLGTQINHRYKLVRLIGSGGQGSVYEAIDLEREKRRVAVKVLDVPSRMAGADRADGIFQRFRREAEISDGLDHPQIARVYDYGLDETNKVAWMAQQFLDGYSLSQELQEGKVYSPEEGIKLILSIAGVLDYIHQNGVIHRDLKPSNIFFHHGLPTLIDFGLVYKQDDSIISKSGQFIGTRGYLPPELVAAKTRTKYQHSSPRDWWGLGCIAFEIFTGRKLFQDDDVELFTVALGQAEEQTKLEELLGDHPALPLIKALLERDPEKRVSSKAGLDDVVRGIPKEALENYSRLPKARFMEGHADQEALPTDKVEAPWGLAKKYYPLIGVIILVVIAAIVYPLAGRKQSDQTDRVIEPNVPVVAGIGEPEILPLVFDDVGIGISGGDSDLRYIIEDPYCTVSVTDPDIFIQQNESYQISTWVEAGALRPGIYTLDVMTNLPEEATFYCSRPSTDLIIEVWLPQPGPYSDVPDDHEAADAVRLMRDEGFMYNESYQGTRYGCNYSIFYDDYKFILLRMWNRITAEFNSRELDDSAQKEYTVDISDITDNLSPDDPFLVFIEEGLLDPVYYNSITEMGTSFTRLGLAMLLEGFINKTAEGMHELGLEAVNHQENGIIEFADVEEDDTGYSAIMTVTTEGFMPGFEDGRWHPEYPITRCQLAMILAEFWWQFLGQIEYCDDLVTPEELSILFPDDNLERVIREAVGRPTGSIPHSELTDLTELMAYRSGISDIEGLQLLENLLSLNLLQNGISDISQLESLTNLTMLDLWGNQITDITPLTYLTKLETLYLIENQISDISPLSKLANLGELLIRDNQIRDLTPLTNLEQLVTIILSNNMVQDISPLSNLHNLQSLSLKGNNISDIAQLANMTNLTDLDLGTNNISDITPLAGLVNLTSLNLYENEITDISPLAGLTDLQHLYIRHNPITDFSPLAGLTNLTWLWLSKTSISDLTPLANLTLLTDLSMYTNEIQDLTPISNLTELESLTLNENIITDISAIANMTKLTDLSISSNQIIDVNPLAELQQLKWLDLSDNQITDIGSLKDLENLEFLTLSGNPITDLAPLVNNPGIGDGDTIRLADCLLSEGAINEQIPALEDRGVIVILWE